MFPTTMVGSYTRPSWLIEATLAHKEGRISSDQLEELRQQAKLLTIKELEEVGLDIISDGEQERTSFYEYMTEQLTGFVFAKSKPFVDGTRYVALRKPEGKVEMRGEPVALKESEFLRAHTRKLCKIAVISPSFLANYWEPGGYYSSRDAFLEDAIRASKLEARALAGNVDYIQWDDPGLSLFTEPSIPESKARELTRKGVYTVNSIIESASFPSSTVKCLHICWGNYRATHQADGPLMRIYPELLNLKVDMLLLEMASARHEDDIEVFKEYPSAKKIAAGVVDVKTPDIEPVRVIRKRVGRALKYVDPEKLVLSTDCGFAVTWDSDRIPRSSCFFKLRSMVLAAEELRREYK